MRNFIVLLVMVLMALSCQKDDVNVPCPDGFTGANCDREIPPSRMFIESIRIKRFPSTESNGDSWDVLSPNPDLLITFGRKGQSPFYTHNTYIQDAVPGQSYTFNNLPIEISDPFNEYELTLWDFDDTSADDFMGGIIFEPYLIGQRFPRTVELDAGGLVAFDVTYRYAFN